MVVIDFKNGGCVFEQCLEFLVSIILGILLNVQGFGLAQFVDERKFTSDLVPIAYEFRREFIY
jgi:hypothetical protein